MLLVLAVAALPRLLALDLVGFDHNQEEILKLVDPIVDEGRWPLVGWEISGRFDGSLPALLFWLLAIPRFLTLSPAALVGFGAAFDVAAAGLTCVLGRRLLGRWPGLAAGLLYASDAYLAEHARILWNVTMLPCFTALTLLGVVAWAVDRKPWGLVPIFLGLSCLTQLHLLTVYLVPPLVLVALVLRPPLAWKPLLVALLAGGALYLPYGWNELRNDFPNLRAARSIATHVFGERTAGEEDADTIEADAAINRAILSKAVAFHRFRFAVDQLPPEARLTPVVDRYQGANRGRSAAFVVGLVVLGAWALRGARERGRDPAAARRGRVALVLIAFHYLPLVVLAQASFRLYERYVLPIFPAPFLILVVPLAALLAWSPAARRPRAMRAVGLSAAAAALIGLVVTHAQMTRFTRALSAELGVIAEAATLGTKTEVARFLLSRGIDFSEFRSRVHFFQWPEMELAERGVGYGPIFRWLTEEEGEVRAPGPAVGGSERRWIVFYAFEGRHLVPDVDAAEVVEEGHVLMAAVDAARFRTQLRSTLDPGGAWWEPGLSPDGWTRNPMPFTTGRSELDAEGRRRDLYLHLDAEVDRPLADAYLLYKTRACVQGMALDGRFVAGAPCPPGDAKEELPKVLRSLEVGPALTPGEHVLRAKLVPRYVSTWFDAFVMPMRRPGVPLEPPFRELLYGDFLYPELYRYRVPDPLPSGRGRPAGHWPRTPEELDRSLDAGIDTRLATTVEEDASGPVYHLAYDFEGYEAWVTMLFGTEPHVDLSGAQALTLSLRTNGRGGALRVALKELDGDEWEHWEELAMWEREWVTLVVPLADLERDPYWAQGDHVKDLSFVTTVMVQLSPGRRELPIRELELWLRPPRLVGGDAERG